MVEYGDGAVVRANLILHTRAGSRVHGIHLGDDDTDEMGVYVDTPQSMLGTSQAKGSYLYRTRDEGERSGKGDLDFVAYSLQKFLILATKGNPSILIPLFVPDSDVLFVDTLGAELRNLAPVFHTRSAGRRFLGYMDAQVERLQGGGKRNRVPNRPELIAKYGFDTKYAAHALRLGYQGIEFLTTGRLTLPMREDIAEQLRAVRQGAVSLRAVTYCLDGLRNDLTEALDKAEPYLPEHPHTEAINAWSADAHREHWKRLGY